MSFESLSFESLSTLSSLSLSDDNDSHSLCFYALSSITLRATLQLLEDAVATPLPHVPQDRLQSAMAAATDIDMGAGRACGAGRDAGQAGEKVQPVS